MSAMSWALTKRSSEVLTVIILRTSSSLLPRVLALAAITRSMRGPATGPGWMALTRIENRPSSRDSDLVRPTTAHFDAE